MIVFKLVVKGQELTLSEQSPPVEKTRNLIKCVFDFQTDDWNETIKTAYFRNATTGIITSQVLHDNQCLIPIEALSETGYIAFSVAGEKEDYRITSSVVQFFNRATVYGGNSSDPTPSQYEQIMAAAAAAQTAAESAEKTADYIKEQAESGAFNGEQGPQGEKGETGPQGEKGEDGKAATITVGSVTTAQPGTSAAVSNSGTPNAAVLDFVIPQGEKGDTGATGAQGPQGEKGDAYLLTDSDRQEIASLVKIPTANENSIGGIKAKEADGETLLAAVDENGFLLTKDFNSWKKIASFTASEDIAQVEITQDMQGNPFSVENLVILIRGVGSAANTSGAKDFHLYTAAGSEAFTSGPYQRIFQPLGSSFSSLLRLSTMTDSEAVYTYNGMNESTPRPNSNSGSVQGAGISYSVGGKFISYIKIKCGVEGYLLGAGTSVEIWGC